MNGTTQSSTTRSGKTRTGTTRSRVLAALRDTEGYLSGQELCERLQISRTAVWKAVQKLSDDGYRIEAVQNKGYRLLSLPETLSAEELESRLKTRWLGKRVYAYDTVDSTNNRAKQLAMDGAENGAVVLSEIQTAGKGRRGRSWCSPPGSGIWMSLILKPEFMPECAPMLTLVMAHSVAMGIREATGLEAGIKWPNDVVVNRKKVCGILTEMSAEVDYIHHIVIGCGINVNIGGFPDEIAQTATSLQIEAGRTFSRAAVAEHVLNWFEKDYEIFLKDLDLSGLKDIYNELLVGKDGMVRVMEPKGEYSGISRGIDERGELLVEKEDKTLQKVYAGEVSVRGVYGYI